MTFAGMNFVAVLAAAIAAWLFGAAYYGLLGKAWLAAQERSAADISAMKRTAAFYVPFVLSFVAESLMAVVLSGLMGHIGAVTVRAGIISGLFVWGGFVLTTLAVNNAYSGRRWLLTLIDAGHWFGVLIIQGAVIGGFGI